MRSLGDQARRTEAHVDDRRRRRGAVALGAARAIGSELEAAAPVDALPGRWSPRTEPAPVAGIARRGIGKVTVAAPLPHVAVHVVQPEGIGLIAPHERRTRLEIV